MVIWSLVQIMDLCGELLQLGGAKDGGHCALHRRRTYPYLSALSSQEERLQRLQEHSPESQDQNLVLTDFFVFSSLDSRRLDS